MSRKNQHKFSWGDSVRVTENAPQEARPGEIASVCGIRDLDQPTHVLGLEVRVGTVLYLVEFGDGSAVEVPEEFLQNFEDG